MKTLKDKIINILEKRKGYTSDLGGFHFLAEDFFNETAFEIAAEIRSHDNPESLYLNSLEDCCHQLLDAIDLGIPPTKSVLGLRILLNRDTKKT